MGSPHSFHRPILPPPSPALHCGWFTMKPKANGRMDKKERDKRQLCDCGVAHKICPVRCLPPLDNPQGCLVGRAAEESYTINTCYSLEPESLRPPERSHQALQNEESTGLAALPVPRLSWGKCCPRRPVLSLAHPVTCSLAHGRLSNPVIVQHGV